MTYRPVTVVPFVLAIVGVVGCASVPEVEQRLQTIGFQPNLYIVRAGDTLETIAFRYRLSPETLAALNPGLGPVLVPGTRLNVRPGTTLPPRPRASTPRTARGDETERSASDWDVSARREAEALGEGSLSREPPVIVSAVTTPRASPPELLPEAVPEARAETLVPGAGAREEIVAADDAEAALAARRAALDAELERYVGEWTWPTEGAVARGFAPERVDGQGVDIAGVPGQEVRAARDGEVVYSGRDLSGEGRLVIVRHEDGLMTTYSHAAELYVEESDRVRAGDTIASLGWNGREESVLRFEVRRDGVPLDPLDFLPPR